MVLYNTCGLCFFLEELFLIWPLAVFLASISVTSSSNLLTFCDQKHNVDKVGENNCEGHSRC